MDKLPRLNRVEQGFLVVDADLENSYETLAEDISELVERGLIFAVKNDTSHRDVLYYVEYPLPETFPPSVSDETRYAQLW